jgi:predicted transcriptional regulator
MAIMEDRIGAHVAAKKAMTRSLVVRVSDELHGKLQHLAEKVSKKYGTKATVSDVARAVLEEATTTRELPASRHGVQSDARGGRLPARTHRGRQATGSPAERGDTKLP